MKSDGLFYIFYNKLQFNPYLDHSHFHLTVKMFNKLLLINNYIDIHEHTDTLIHTDIFVVTIDNNY